MNVHAQLRQPGFLIAAASVAILVTLNGAALLLAPDHTRSWIVMSALVAVGAGLQSAASEPSDLGPALLFTLPAVMALAGDGAPTWLIAPCGALLLAAGELNTLAWECRGVEHTGTRLRARLADIARITVLGAGAGVVILLARALPAAPGRASILIAATALVGLGHTLFRPTR